MKRTLVGVIAASLLIVSMLGIARATGRGTHPLTYKEQGGNGPRLVVKGEGCLQAEDSTRLRLVEWTGAEGKAVYRCIQP